MPISVTGRPARYRIKGIRAAQGVVSLVCAAASLEEAHAYAKAQGVDVVTIREVRNGFGPVRQRPANFDLLLFSQELQALMIAGLSIVEALSAVARKEPPSYKRDIVESLTRQLREGKSFSQALQAHASEFPPLYLALTSASERTGDLPHALSRFIAYRIRMDELRKRIGSALLYPGLLLGVGGLVVLFLMLYVVPRFSRIYEDFGRDLPFMSRLLMDWGSLVSKQGGALLACAAAALALAIVLVKPRVSFQGALDLLGRFGPLHEKLRLFEISRFYRTTGLLQQGGIPLITAMSMGRALLGGDLGPQLDLAIADIRAGMALSGALERHGLAPPVALDLIKVGERSGELGEKLIRIADFFDEEQSRWIETFTRLFEPLLMLVIGLVIAGIVVLLYLPIFDLAGNLQ